MPQIDVTNEEERWQYACPECGKRYWRANDGIFECRSCGALTPTLVDLRSGEEVHRDDFEFVGAHVSWKAPYATGRRAEK